MIRRRQLFEFTDLEWLPPSWRRDLTRIIGAALAPSHALARTVIAAELKRTGARRIVDLGSGSGSHWSGFSAELARRHGIDVEIVLTERHEFSGPAETTEPNLRRHRGPVDAHRLPAELEGFVTLFSCFHHFPPQAAAALLRQVSDRRLPFGIFEVVERSPSSIVAMVPATLAAVLMVPFLRPFSWSRLLWTFAIPVLPLLYWWDASASQLRAYSKADLEGFAATLADANYRCEIGRLSAEGIATPLTYLIGVPAERDCRRRAA
jgi:hypothetical protein